MLFWQLSLLVVLWLQPLASKAAPSSGKVQFNRDIRPILADHCYSCHGPDKAKRKAGLRLDERVGALTALESGKHAIVPGDVAKSRILEVVATSNDDDRMPPAKTGKRLSAHQIDLLTRWIREGAEFEAHWAYVAPEKQPLPAVKQREWVRNPMDHFILARLEKEGLPPSEEADRKTLARRASLDVTGMPPSVEELDQFLNDRSPVAYERYVDRLLASEAYGERMAVHWLDLARFADSDGYHADIQRSMWQYRDYVIKAFNENKSFDRFVIEQLAGDLLPKPSLEQRIATAFNRNGMSSTEGGADPDEYMNKYVTDRVNTFGTVFLGSSISCTECHNHKYDPFTQREYYQLYDFFNRIPEKGLDADPAPPFVKVPVGRQMEEYEAARAKREAAEAAHKDLTTRPDPAWDKAQAEWEQRLVSGARALEGFKLADWHSVGPFPAPNLKEAFNREFGPEKSADLKAAFLDGKFSWKPRPEFKDGKVHNLEGEVAAVYLRRTLTADSARKITFYVGSDDAIRVWLNGKEILSREVNRAAAPNQDEATGELVAGENQVLLKVVNGGGAFAFYFSTDRDAGDERLAKLREWVKLPVSERKPDQIASLRRTFREREIAEVKQASEAFGAALKREGELDRAIATIRVMEDMPVPRPSHIRIRGDYRSKGDQVTAGVPVSALPGLESKGSTNRLDLAEWLVDRRHPLTARVAVNRFWGLYFPNPLVKTSNEFGTQGEPPSHPELLDFLAREFVDTGWDVKALVKTILTSATYRQSSKVRADHRTIDPENRLLARGPRHRLSAEVIRDSALAVSGLLVPRIGGPSVRPYQPPGLWEEKMFSGNKYEVGKGEELYRRSLYTLWKRSVLNPTMQTFDAPDRAICSVSRPSTCTPLQALVTMNDVTYVEAARVFAQRILREGGSDPRSRLEFAFRTALSRKPHDREQEIIKRVLADVRRSYEADAAAADKLTKLGAAPRSGQGATAELAAWTGVASLILNLDEMVTKE